MVVNRSDFDAALQELAHNRIDLGLGEHQVTHDQRTVLHRLEAKSSAQRQSRLDCNAVERHLQITARNAVAVDFASYRSRLAERGVYFWPVDFAGICLADECKRQNENKK
jgi:uncharacterized protein YbcV (DUF1398 family)